MDFNAIKTLGYIYSTTEWNKKISREYFTDITRMGKYTCVLTETAGMVVFKGTKGVEKGGKIFYLNTKTILNEYKRTLRQSIKDNEDRKKYLQDSLDSMKRQEENYHSTYERMDEDIQKYFSEDKFILEKTFTHE